MSGKATILGIYSLPVDRDLLAEQASILYGESPSHDELTQVREQLESAVLVEVLVNGADADFAVGDFTQPDPALPRENWQAAWAEAFLTEDGQRLLVDRWEPLPEGAADFRVAFYMHYWRVGEPLRTSYGSVATPPPQVMPQRLSRLVPYELLG